MLRQQADHVNPAVKQSIVDSRPAQIEIMIIIPI
tara:strand:- start:410 stop:511 length:102 start_codon:yes stop_codon:yes gene_type:complete